MSVLARILQQRDAVGEWEAHRRVAEARLRVSKGADPRDVLKECFNLNDRILARELKKGNNDADGF